MDESNRFDESFDDSLAKDVLIRFGTPANSVLEVSAFVLVLGRIYELLVVLLSLLVSMAWKSVTSTSFCLLMSKGAEKYLSGKL